MPRWITTLRRMFLLGLSFVVGPVREFFQMRRSRTAVLAATDQRAQDAAVEHTQVSGETSAEAHNRKAAAEELSAVVRGTLAFIERQGRRHVERNR